MYCIHFVTSYGSVTVLSVMEGQQLCTLLNWSVGANSGQTVPSHALSEMAFLPPRVLGHSSKYVSRNSLCIYVFILVCICTILPAACVYIICAYELEERHGH